MELNSLTAISPLDGRYRSKVDELHLYFSEYGLIKYRLMVEIEYFIALCGIPLPQLNDFRKENFKQLRSIYEDFDLSDAEKIKEREKITNHDIKAIEYFLKERFFQAGWGRWSEFIHFGLTSQDINNTAIPLSVKDALISVYYPILYELRETLATLADEWKDIPMLGRTHGQPASPTRLGKEIQVFIARIDGQTKYFGQIPFSAKFGGATGNFNAHKVAYPDIDWITFANNFVNEELGLQRSHPTTQIEHYDNLAALFDNMRRINTILIDLSRDVWTYISMDYFSQKIKKGEIGSSAMPHKVNPIDFENGEGNLGYANAIFEHLSMKLPVSRLQRDLTDSTVIRNVGVPIGHSVLAFSSILKGLNKLIVNSERMKTDLENNWVVVSEAIQTILRREGFPNPYEALLELTRTNQKITGDSIKKFIDDLDISEELKAELKAITPMNYTGF
ncbi:MAG: adenylosuccinate lyase [Bacteroidetes bacterium GWE2_41_25]|nr:MAG: adenylosuccinate lyase [Bacteroidetes bacterium GWA2_40_15]OFY00500.1 MAG: adenylosuccinate lyase [Bacteroidetes bacterium GWC2_40_22]OFY11947.1 MAG: adenylosuccinate lyase [Bacteroidetes bacterium GWE2_41_25]OFY56763.1 MAG: adenylosuccinate lyase [Bacteroidetes bacterium GWF2_41_9]HAM10242.1 adenylosuccinate lyase [Bacteroidales bacterium]